MLHKIGAVAVVISGAILFAVPAEAAVYDFTYVGGVNDPTVSGSGTFTTNAAGTLVISGSAVFTMDTASGGTTLFAATADTAGLSSDNVFPIDSSAGLLFQGTSNPNFYVNIFAPTGNVLNVGTSDAWLSAVNGGGYLVGSLGFAGICNNCVADGTLNVAATPLPATWGMMLLGLGVLGFMGYRRRKDTRALVAV